MKKSPLIFLGLFFAMSFQTSAGETLDSPTDWLDPDKAIEERIEGILQQLTLEEKAALCHAQGKFSSPGVPRLGIPELWYSDGPHGVRAEINWNNWGYAGWTSDSCTAFPALTCLAASFDPSLALEYGRAIGQEARYRKKDVLLGPGVNIYRTPLNGRNFEYLGEDPCLAAAMVAPYVQGVQENGVAACVKHYALNNQETDRGHIMVEVSQRALHEIYLPAFKAAAQAGAWSFMGAYNQYNGEHCCHNDLLINQILKGRWGWDGVLITDWGGAHDTRQAVFNGLDIEMGTYTNGLTSESAFGYNDYYLADPFLKGIKDGSYPIELLNDKVRRILRLMLRTTLAPRRPLGSFATEAHARTAREIAAAGIVLLKNDKKLLPLSPGLRKIAVIGENATRNLMQGGGSSELKPWRSVTPLQALGLRYPDAEIVYAQGYDSGKAMYSQEGVPTHDPARLHEQAVQAARDAELVIFVGGLNKNHRQDCEAADRKSYELPFGQPELIRDLALVNPRIVVVLLSGNAVESSWAAQVPAIVQGWYGGSEAGNALVDVLSGDVCPSGKLPFSFPEKLGDNAAMSFGSLSYPGDGKRQVYMEDILVGYRWHDTRKIPAAWPFGHGLSYTSFSLGKARLDKKTCQAGEQLTVSVPVSNTGKCRGAQVIQLYVSQPKASVPRPAKELKAFSKIWLDPGESRTVEITVPVDCFAYYDETRQDWHLEAGEYLLRVGTSSTEIHTSLKVSVQ
ncbi:MAG: glycoside hydrolase family 3 C-terminal domain-containing protein [Bacteroidales bacterium]|nr:glycoside hydrolase family 3 C-terminal domain-containing protein [Bacteroidales bacterium]